MMKLTKKKNAWIMMISSWKIRKKSSQWTLTKTNNEPLVFKTNPESYNSYKCPFTLQGNEIYHLLLTNDIFYFWNYFMSAFSVKKIS